MAKSTIPCPHCKKPVTLTVGQIERCPACGGEVRVHAVGENEQDEALKRLLSKVKIVERVGDSSTEADQTALVEILGMNEPNRMDISNAYYLIVDLEATCSDDGSVPKYEMEIIEIGAVVQNSQTFEIESEFQTFVRPIRHPRLTAFCNELTGIRQDMIADAPLFPEAIASFKQWMSQFDDALFCSWGDYDRNQFIQDCDYHEIDYPFQSGHLNLKAAFARTLNLRGKLGISQALRHLGMKFEGAHHRGLDDARNIARIVRRVCKGT